MFDEIYADEVKTLVKQILSYHKYRCQLARSQWKKTYNVHSNLVIISDGTTIEDILLPVLAERNTNKRQCVNVFDDSNFNDTYLEKRDSLYDGITFDDFKEQTYNDTSFILLIDSNKHDLRWIDVLRVCRDKAQNGVDNKILVAILIPAVKDIPDKIEKLGEREYSFLLEKINTNHTESEKFAIQIEAECRAATKMFTSAEMTFLRFDNLFGSTGVMFKSYDLESMVKKAFTDGEVIITKEDRLFKLSCMYTRDAVMCLLCGLDYGKHGHVYNVTQYFLSIADFKEKLHKLYPDRIALKTDGLIYSNQDITYHNLSSLKFFHEQVKLLGFMKSFETAFYSSLCCWISEEFDVVSKLTCYEGKLNRLKSAEIDILMEIDRICKKHDINYFLAGGSCLGAIRDNKSIPWDDDLDIGMLREDFEKFRKVAPKELNEKYVYSSPAYDENCHYYFDKIRLKDTYFSTFYSNKFVLDDGVFVDIVVYDQTTNCKSRRNWQIKLISYMVKLIYLRWHGYPVGKGKRKRLAKRILPIMNKIPFKWYHKCYDKFAMRYSKKKNPEYVLDGGTHLTKGPFRRESIVNVEYTEFDGMKNAPIPTGYDEYLTFLYGENYRPAPSLSSRLAAHKIARLDLGKYLFENNPKQTFRSVNIKGELYESEEEK